ncbi:MAG: kinesin-like protein Klp8 [Heterodermia speciosa]|uniref:Kinesin-like protein Klp8 n=1 Tax=Heterodermia speciosa TaxID=116794 RepID=A0A8H3EK05_9LECA|nr:MAG: kinesin-like protein Klp8 [Heterodermia speciosa]
MAGGNIKVVVRVRPFNGRELDRKAKCVVQMKDAQTILVPPPDAEERLRGSKGGKGEGQKVFAFDKSYWSFNRRDPHFAGQDDLFADLGSPLLDNAFKGYNNCIFAYGQTGSGKSYSMMGYGDESGVIPRICQNMFERITELQKDQNLSYTVEVSYLEIYNERVRDLLNPSTKGNLKVREHPSTGPYVEDLAKLVVRSFPEIQHLMDEGNKARTVAATSMNETSSRSHAVFTLTVTQKRHDVETSMDTERVAKISLVDLAGSERATSTGATGARLKEGAEINRSLSTLGRVIAALADLSTGKKKNMSMVPYRDSVLTWLLKDSLGGNSMTAMIAAISPADINFEETLSTLRYADSAKRIKNHAVVNEDPNARMIRELKEELAQLRSKLSSGATTGGIAEEQYAPDTPLDQQIVSITQADGTVKKVSKADIAEQLNQSEKLYDDLNQTWEDKLQKTEQIHKEREAALEELGISIEKGFVGLSTPKKMPHLVNLSDDPLLAECLVYNIKPGTTAVGNVDDPNTTSEIRLNGSKIHPDHCAFENVDGLVTLVPKDGAAIMVNGLRLEKPKRLRSGDRVILGDFHIFRFNHPQEARDERKEQSLLRHAITTSQLGSPMPRPGHSRTISRAESDTEGETSRSHSPLPQRNGRDSDWSYARREAAGAILGADQKIAHLTDDELDSLFDDVQRVRAVRKGRPESRLFGPDEEDFESISSYPYRDKYMSNGTIDNFSLDTALTLPNSPPLETVDGVEMEDSKPASSRDEPAGQTDDQREERQETQSSAGSTDGIAEALKRQNETMEEALKAAREDFHRQIQQQKEEFHDQLKQMSSSPSPRTTKDGFANLPGQEKDKARYWISRWRQTRNVSMAEFLLKRAAILKEVQIMSQAMDKNVVFQFAVVGEGQSSCSSYDLVLSGISGDEDEALEIASKPCVAIRLMDYQHAVIRLWSLEKLEFRLQAMRQIHQYLCRPEMVQHFQLENPFTEPCMPRFSLIGEASVPLTAVFQARVQDYSLEVVSTFTQSTVGVVRLSLEPSSAQAPSTMLKFNVVMHDLVGFPEHEGTDVHAQLIIPGISDEGGATTTQMINNFDEDRICFESVHSMSLPSNSPRTASLRISLYAKITSMHMDKLRSWDEMREANEAEFNRKQQLIQSRRPESEYYVQEQHDVFAKFKILELSETGEYLPVEAEQNSNLDPGTYQLRQGLQRRIVVNLSYSSSESLQWIRVKGLRVGDIRLLDPGATVPHTSSPKPDVMLRFVDEPKLAENGSGTKELIAVGQWDSSLHGSTLLDRPTSEGYIVQIAVSADITSSRVKAPMTFSLNQNVQIRPRSWLRPQSLFKQLWKTARIVHSTSGMFSVILRPASPKCAADIWRMDSSTDYVKGEELLSNWKPRGLSLIRDFLKSKQRQLRVADVEEAKVLLGRRNYEHTPGHNQGDISDSHQQILRKCLSLWTTPTINTTLPSLSSSLETNPTSTSGHPSPSPSPRPNFISNISFITKNPLVLMSSYVLSPTPTSQTRWARHFAELRPPYLHVYNVPSGEQAFIINLRHARIDTDPPLQHLLCGDGGQAAGWGKNVWAVYGAMNTWLFAARSEKEKSEWILAIDEAFMGE